METLELRGAIERILSLRQYTCDEGAGQETEGVELQKRYIEAHQELAQLRQLSAELSKKKVSHMGCTGLCSLQDLVLRCLLCRYLPSVCAKLWTRRWSHFALAASLLGLTWGCMADTPLTVGLLLLLAAAVGLLTIVALLTLQFWQRPLSTQPGKSAPLSRTRFRGCGLRCLSVAQKVSTERQNHCGSIHPKLCSEILFMSHSSAPCTCTTPHTHTSIHHTLTPDSPLTTATSGAVQPCLPLAPLILCTTTQRLLPSNGHRLCHDIPAHLTGVCVCVCKCLSHAVGHRGT